MAAEHPDRSAEGASTLSPAEIVKYGALVVAVVAVAVGGRLAASRFLRDDKSQPAAPDQIQEADLAALVESQVEGLAHGRAGEPADADGKASVAKDSVNRLLPDASFIDLAGRDGSLREYRGRTLIVSMTSVDCPISKKLVPALVRLAEEFRDIGAELLLVNADGAAAPDELTRHAALLRGWRYVHDKDGTLARTLGARTTTEAFVIDRAQTLRYRGAVDDRFDVGVQRAEADNEFLRQAAANVLADQPVDAEATEAPGCVLGLSPLNDPAPPVTWHNQISRTVQRHCADCHRPGEAAPFALETYEQVVAKSAMIELALDENLMPPWFADHAYGQWRNDRRVSDADKATFRQWAAAGCPEGDPQDAPASLRRASGWTIGEPDVVIDVPPQHVPAEGLFPWSVIPVEFEAKEDMWVSAAEIRPSAPEVVHHAMLFVEYADDDPRKSTQTGGESGQSRGATGFWSSYFPGRKAMILPPGRGKLIPRNGKVSIQLHYNPNGAATVDHTTIGLKLLAKPPERAVVSGSIIKWDIQIPPNSKALFVHSETFNEDVRLVALMPHMHCRGAAAQVFLRRPDGQVETLLNVPRYDFNWQVSYEFRKPLLVTRGSQMIIRHEYDNREENPSNPDPTKALVHGDNTTDEMMINFFDWEPAGDGSPPKPGKRPFQ